MNIDPNVDIDVFINLFDIVIILLLVWGGYKGFVKGAIIESISLFALFAGMAVSAVLTKLIYNYLMTVSAIPDLFSSFMLGIFFLGAIWFSIYISKKVKENVGEVSKSKENRLIGMGLGVVKYFFMIAIYVIVIYKVNFYADILPPGERKSKLANSTKWVLTKIFPHLKMENHDIIVDKDTTIFQDVDNTNF